MRGLDSVPNSCSAGPRSQLRWPLEIPVQVQSDSRQKARPGTEFLDAETGRQKSPLEPTNAHRDKNPGMEWPEIRAETPYLASYRKRPVCGDWMVVCAVRYEPVSLLFAKNRVIFRKNSERIARNTRKRLTAGTFHLFSQIDNREKQGSWSDRNREWNVDFSA